MSRNPSRDGFIITTIYSILRSSEPLNYFQRFFFSRKLDSETAMRFLCVALMGLASISVTTASDFQSWDDIVGDAPQCIKSCLDDFYSNAGLKDECGSSDDASMNCLCNASSFTAAQSSANDLSTCIQKGCDSGDLSELSSSLSDFQDRFMDAAEQCQSGGKLFYNHFLARSTATEDRALKC
jgi:hypothetical protein